MKSILLTATITTLALRVFALEGQYTIHDPSTVTACEGKYYTFGTGGGALVSDDGWNWRSGTRAIRSGMAPDVIHVGDRYYQYIAANIGGQPRAAINMISSKSMNPDSPDYKWEEGGVVCSTDGVEDCNGIDPGVLLDPTDGRMWLSYGSYFGYIRIVQLDPKTGKRVDPNDKPINVAINCEASVLIYREGYYYLLATHGSCCRGSDSGYNIRVGRSKSVVGPYVDQTGLDMIQGGGKLFCGSGGRYVGAGHFGLIDVAPGLQKYSMHWEADFDKGGASVLDIRPVLWKDGWPVSGENMKEGTYQIESVRTGTTLELAVEGVPVGGRRGGRGGGMGGGARGPGGMRGGGAGGMPATPGGVAVPGGQIAPAAPAEAGARGARGGMGGGMGGGMFGGSGGGVVAPQEASQVSSNWPAGNIDLRMANYMCQAQQKWTITPLTNSGGFLGSPFFKITVAGTDRALAATAEGELVTLPKFSGAPEQLWQIDQLTDGTWRIMPKSVPNAKEPLALSAVGSSFATLARFDPTSDKQRWTFKAP
jgi:arabinan endo-1,5-alpha-L-arabinosidase